MTCFNDKQRDNNEDHEDDDYEDIVHRAWGKYGLYQIGLNFVLALIYIPVNWQMLSMNFLAAKTDFYCRPPDGSSSLWNTSSAWIDFAHPKRADGSFDFCNVYNLNYSALVENPHLLSSVSRDRNESVRTCDRFVHDTDFWLETVRHKWDLICSGDKWYGYMNSIFMTGVGAGVVLGGFASDRFGRKPTMFALIFVQSLSALIAAFIDSFPVWIALRWFTYFGLMSALAVRYVLGMEMLSGKYRAYVGIGFFLFEPIGVILYPFLAGWLRDSYTLQIAMALANVPILCMYIFVPESPRWLLRKGRLSEARAVLMKGAEFNNREFPADLDLDNNNDEAAETRESHGNFLTLFKTPKLRTFTLALILIWFGHGFIYYGIALNIGDLGSDLFTNFVLFGAVDIPGFAAAVANLAFLPRKKSYFLLMITTSVLLMLTVAFVPKSTPTIALAMTGKFTLVVTFVGLYLYSGEIYPTLVRNVGLGACSLGARLGSVLGPLTYGLREFQPDFFPSGFLGCVFLVCALAVLALPETFNEPLPSTITELENRDDGDKGNNRKRKNKPHNHQVEWTIGGGSQSYSMSPL